MPKKAPRCVRPGRREGENLLEIDLAVVLDLLAVFDHCLHDGVSIRALGKFDSHLLGHEIDGGLLYALGLTGGLLHEVGAVCAVNFDLIGLFDDASPLFLIHLNN